MHNQDHNSPTKWSEYGQIHAIDQSNNEKSFIAHKDAGADDLQYQCSVSNPFSALRDTVHVENAPSYSAALRSNINTHKSAHIPVIISDKRTDKQTKIKGSRDALYRERMHNVVQNNKYDDDDDDDEDDFETYVRRKTKRFYVGGFCPTMTEKKLTNYV